MLTEEEVAKLERELRIARQKVFENESYYISEIARIKKLLEPIWKNREDEIFAARNENYFM